MNIIKKIKEGLFQGLGIGLGLVIILGLLLFAYAFVEPTSSPQSTSFYVNRVGPLWQDLGSLSPNNGMYNNRIAKMSPTNNYTEICWKNGAVQYDIKAGGTSTDGGNCVPGDVGFIIEQNERSSLDWSNAKADCLKDNMRLPEIFEFKFSCKNATTFGLNSMTNNWEWTSNLAIPANHYNNYAGTAASVLGYMDCKQATFGWVGYRGTTTSGENIHSYRCAR